MTWDRPQWLFLLWLLPALGWLLWLADRRRRAAALAFAEAGLLPRLLPPRRPGRTMVRAGAIVLGIAALVVAAARPRWGEYYEHVTQRGSDLLVLLDVSRSMLAQDVAPNRLDRAKADVRDLVARLSGDRVGLIVFAGRPVLRVPLTSDHGFFLQALSEVDPASAPRGGSLIGDAIRKGIESFEARADRDRVLVLITDGEDHDSYPAEAAQQAADQNIRIFTIGLGDPREGARVPTETQDGQSAFVKYQGAEVWSKVDEKLLQEIALVTQGAYIPARTRVYDLGQVYEEHLSGLTRGELSVERRRRYRDRFQVFLALALGLLCLARFLPCAPLRSEVMA